MMEHFVLRYLTDARTVDQGSQDVDHMNVKRAGGELEDARSRPNGFELTQGHHGVKEVAVGQKNALWLPCTARSEQYRCNVIGVDGTRQRSAGWFSSFQAIGRIDHTAFEGPVPRCSCGRKRVSNHQRGVEPVQEDI